MSTFTRITFTLGLLMLLAGAVYATEIPPASPAADPLPPIVFVARSHLATQDTIFRNEVGPAGQFGTGLTKFAPQSVLVRRDPDGALTVYNTPGLIDVQSPDVSFDGSKILFAGATTLNRNAADYGWRLYEIGVDGSGFRQLTFGDRIIEIPNAGDFGNQETYGAYDDLFPAYLADGRIVFTSSRYPARSHYDARRSFNLYVMNGDGSGMHRITTDRGGFLHPTPLPDGRILATRWWNQFNQPSERGVYNRIDNAAVNRQLPDGTTILANPDAPFNPAEGYLADGFPIRQAPNTWHLMALKPDGRDLQRFMWTARYPWNLTDDSGFFDTYAAAQPAPFFSDGQLFVAFTMQTDSTMVHSTLKSGIRVGRPGVDMMAANATDAIAGLGYDKAWQQNDESGPYALHPWGLPNGAILFSLSHEDNSLPTSGAYVDDGVSHALQGSNLRYRLYVMDRSGANQTPVDVNLAAIGRPQADVMDARPIVPRVGWQALGDSFTAVPHDDPRLGNIPNTFAQYWFSLHGPGDIETAILHNPNIYANASLHRPFVNNSPPPGSVAQVEVWLDANQFTGAYCYNGWPQPCDDFRSDAEVRAVRWGVFPVTPAGAFTVTVPADTMSFIFLRDAAGRAVRGWERGYISIAQGNAYARPGETVTCTGCHMGHVSGSLDDVIDQVEAGWTNIAPYAAVQASSFREHDDPDYPDYEPFHPIRVRDRRGWVPAPAGQVQPYQDEETGWISNPGQTSGEWIELRWPIAMEIASLRLVGPPPNGGDWGGFGQPEQYGDYYVEGGTLTFYLDGALQHTQTTGRILPLEQGATHLAFNSPLLADAVRLRIDDVSGRWWWEQVAALNEIEVIGRAAEPWPEAVVHKAFLPTVRK